MSVGPSGFSAIVFINSLLQLLLAGGGAYLYWKLQRTRREQERVQREKQLLLAYVHDVGEIFSEADKLDAEVLLKRVLVYALNIAKASSGAIYLEERATGDFRARAMSGVFPPLTDVVKNSGDVAASKAKHLEHLILSRPVKRSEGLIGQVADLGAALVVDDAAQDPRIPRHEVDYLRIRQLLLLPLRFHNKTLGVMAVVNRTDAQPFQAMDVTLLQTLCDQASASVHYTGLRETLDEKQRIDHDLSVARHIQDSLLPKELPNIAGVELAAFNDPAKEIGGDYYDFIRIGDRHLGIAIADVSGKGVSGALLMTVCRSVLRSQAPHNLSPAAVLHSINQVMTRDIHEDMFVTMLYMVLDTQTHELAVARAGHERPIQMTRGGQVTFIDSPGIAIGMVTEQVFDKLVGETRVQLAPGDVIVAYTDGITEAMNGQEQEWGQQNFLEAIRVASADGANSVLYNVRERLRRHVGSHPQYDDMTLLAMRHMG